MNGRATTKANTSTGDAGDFPSAAAVRQSQLVDQITAANAEGFRNSQQRIHRNGSMPVFQQGNKNHRQPRFLGERLLRQSCLFAAITDGFTQRASVFWNSRHTPYKQERTGNNIYYSIILDLRNCGRKHKNAPVILKAKGFMKGKTRILIVEDDTPLACWMVSILTHAGCDVETARSGKRAMELASESRFDLITLDIGLPDSTGFEICSELRQRHISRKTPIVFVTASPSEDDVKRGIKLGAVDFIPKPFEATDFIYRIVGHAKARIHQATTSTTEEVPA
jgi:CheY-like chemotaxis protein